MKKLIFTLMLLGFFTPAQAQGHSKDQSLAQYNTQDVWQSKELFFDETQYEQELKILVQDKIWMGNNNKILRLQDTLVDRNRPVCLNDKFIFLNTPGLAIGELRDPDFYISPPFPHISQSARYISPEQYLESYPDTYTKTYRSADLEISQSQIADRDIKIQVKDLEITNDSPIKITEKTDGSSKEEQMQVKDLEIKSSSLIILTERTDDTGKGELDAIELDGC